MLPSSAALGDVASSAPVASAARPPTSARRVSVATAGEAGTKTRDGDEARAGREDEMGIVLMAERFDAWAIVGLGVQEDSKIPCASVSKVCFPFSSQADREIVV